MIRQIKFFSDENAVTSIEYGLLGVLIFLVIITGVNLVGQRVVALFAFIANQMAAAIGG